MVVNKQKQYARQNEWIRKNRARISIDLSKEQKERLQSLASQKGLSLSKLIKNAIDYYLKSEPKTEDNIQSDNNKSDNNNGIKYR